MGVLARTEDDPIAACKPFDLDRNGFVVGEGAAALVMERSDFAEARGAVPYAEWLAGGCVSGSVETACTLLAMRDSMIPPTRNLKTPDPACDLDYTPHESRPQKIGKALKLSLGFGGHQVAAVLGQWHR
jgi:3-oxoacyl-(acyl-carrier-protein) synthase